MKKQIPFLVLTAILASVCGYFGGHQTSAPSSSSTIAASDRILQQREIRCGYVLYPPYLDRDMQTGHLTGPVVKIWDEMGKRLNLKITWSEEVTWGTMISGLQTKRYDAVCSPVWANATRSQFAAFSKPVGLQRLAAWTRVNETKFDKGIAAINQKDTHIAVLDGEMAIMLANRLFPAAQHVALPQNASMADLLLNVITGKADIAMEEDVIIRDFLKHNPGTLKMVPGTEALQKFPVTFLLPQSDTALKNMIDQTIDDLTRDQTLQSIMDQAGLGDVWSIPQGD